MANDGEVKIGTSVDNTGAEKGLKKLSQSLKNFSNKLKSSDFANIGMSITGIGTAVKMATGAIKTAVKAVNEVTEAYKAQARAETQLNTAIKNSPLMDGSSAKALKEYASQIQKVTEYGDDELFPFMAELVNAGRTQEEVMDIIKASTDIASSGMMDLGSAVSALNMTYQGMTGTLGRQISSIKNLTTEELKAGKAVEIIKKQFAGTAEEVAKNVGSTQQLANAWGDLKEEIGAGWEKPLSKIRGWLTNIISDIAKARQDARELGEAFSAGENATEDQSKIRLEELKKRREELQETLKILHDKSYGKGITEEDTIYYGTLENAMLAFKKEAQNYREEIKKLQAEIEPEEERLKLLEEESRIRREEAIKSAKDEEDKKRRIDELNKSTENYNKIIAKRDATIANLKREAEALGEEVDQQAILNAEVTAYLEMATDPNLPTMTGKQLEKVQALVKAQKELTSDEKKYTDFMDALSGIDLDVNKSDILQDQLNMLDELNEAFIQSATFEALSNEKKLQIASEYTQKRKQLEKEITEAMKEEAQEQKTTVEDVLTTINNFFTQFSGILSSITEMTKENAENEATIQTASVKKQFEEGLISESEYLKKKEDIEKESARKQYEMQMWEWSAQLLQIGLATAQAVMNGLQMKPAPLGLAMASTMGLAGAGQLAVAIKNKPIPPSFASGGIVGGGAYSSGDNVRANIKTGEMVLNDKQQLNLWRMAQGAGNGGGGSGTNIQIKNYRGNDTAVTPQVTEDGIKILIRKTVSDDLANRRLNGPLMSAENTLSGIKYES